MHVVLTTLTLSIDGWMRLPASTGLHQLLLIALLLLALGRVLGADRRDYLDYGNLALVGAVVFADLAATGVDPLMVATMGKIALCAYGALCCFAPRVVGLPSFVEQKAGMHFARMPPLFVWLNALWLVVFAALGLASFGAYRFGSRYGWALSAAILGVGFLLNALLSSGARRERV
jgi:hypothetical protein